MALFSRLRSLFGVGEDDAPEDETAHKVTPDDLAPLTDDASSADSYDKSKFFVADSFSFGVEREMKESGEVVGSDDDLAQKVAPGDDVGSTPPDDGLAQKVEPGDDVGATPPDDSLSHKIAPADDLAQKVEPADDDLASLVGDDPVPEGNKAGVDFLEWSIETNPPTAGTPVMTSTDQVGGATPDDDLQHKVSPPGNDVGSTTPDDGLDLKWTPGDISQKVTPPDDDVELKWTPDDTSHKIPPPADPEDAGQRPAPPIEDIQKIPDSPAPPTHDAADPVEDPDGLEYEAVGESELDGADLAPADAPMLSVDDMKSDADVKIPVEPEGVKVDDMKSDADAKFLDPVEAEGVKIPDADDPVEPEGVKIDDMKAEGDFFATAAPADEPTTLVDLSESTPDELQQATSDVDEVVELGVDLEDVGGGGGGDDLLDQ